VCVCERERERKRKRVSRGECGLLCLYDVHFERWILDHDSIFWVNKERGRGRERERGRHKNGKSDTSMGEVGGDAWILKCNME